MLSQQGLGKAVRSSASQDRPVRTFDSLFLGECLASLPSIDHSVALFCFDHLTTPLNSRQLFPVICRRCLLHAPCQTKVRNMLDSETIRANQISSSNRREMEYDEHCRWRSAQLPFFYQHHRCERRAFGWIGNSKSLLSSPLPLGLKLLRRSTTIAVRQ
jgi:hypothetical protein